MNAQLLVDKVANLTAPFAPSPAAIASVILDPLAAAAPVHPVRALLSNLTSTNVHDVYFPFARFAILHASRAALGWAAMTRARDLELRERRKRGDKGAGVGVLGDLFGYLVTAWGGGTLVSFILASPPAWLVSPTQWIIYTLMYFLLIPTGLASFINTTCPFALLSLITGYMDGILRGVGVAGLPTTIAATFGRACAASGDSQSSACALALSPAWPSVVLAPIATTAGGYMVQAFGLNRVEWGLYRPSCFNGGILNTVDIWGAVLASILYNSLRASSIALLPLGHILAASLPADLQEPRSRAVGTQDLTDDLKALLPFVSSDTARALVVILMVTLFVARALAQTALSWKVNAHLVETGGGQKEYRFESVLSVKGKEGKKRDAAAVAGKEDKSRAEVSSSRSAAEVLSSKIPAVGSANGSDSTQAEKPKARKRRGKSKSKTPVA